MRHSSLHKTSAASRGHVIPGAVNAIMEDVFGASFSGVRLFPSSLRARSLGAKAFASGDAIFFADDYSLTSEEGWRVLGHELSHVLQQRLCMTGTNSTLLGPVLVDRDLEQDAECAGDVAALRFRESNAAATFRYAGSAQTTPRQGVFAQCLMNVAAFKHASQAAGMRNKITAVDTALQTFHALDATTPRDYVKILQALRALYAASQTYLQQKGNSARVLGVEKLVREIALEETILLPLSDYTSKQQWVDKIDAVERAQENYLKVKDRPDFTRDKTRNNGWSSSQEIVDLLADIQRSTHGQGVQADIVKRDVKGLTDLLALSTLHVVLKDVIREVTTGANLNQLDYKLWMPGAAYNVANGATQKYTFKHTLEQTRGKKWRLGSLLHELTHVSIAEIFDNQPVMLAISKNATDQQVKDLARLRKQNITGLITLIQRDTGLDAAMKQEMIDKANYPISGKFGTYLANFKARMLPADHQRWMKLLGEGLDCELIEYDTVVNQMALWCALSGIPEGNAVYSNLLTLVQSGYQHRSLGKLQKTPLPIPPRVPKIASTIKNPTPMPFQAALVQQVKIK
jgi:hypothetical protein